jgi:hydrogenase nickel incorporation protein HypA/HybF
MHELSLAMSVVNIAEKEAIKASAQEVNAITLQIGECSGVEINSLEFVWPAAVKNSVLENAAKEFEIIEGKAKCLECETTFHIKTLYQACPECGSYFHDIQKGKEFLIKSIVVT